MTFLRLMLAVSLLGPALGVAAEVEKMPQKLSEAPVWVQDKARAMKDPHQAVYVNRYQGKIVYRFVAPCCDQYNPLFDAQGKRLCAPDGGFTGAGDGKCRDYERKGEVKLR